MNPKKHQRLIGSSRASRVFFVFCAGLLMLAAASGARIYNQSRSQAVSDDDPRLQQYEKPGVRFDMLVRDDFFDGMFGDNEALERGMRFCEKVLAKHPRHAEALVWHGGGLLTRSSQVYAKGDSALGDQLFQRGLKEMNEARDAEPANIGVRIGRAATLIGISQSGFDAADSQGRELLESAVRDYEMVLAAQQVSFARLPLHNRGELLFGLASGWSMLGNQKKTRFYLTRITKDCKGSSYEREARAWLDMKPVPKVDHQCLGCHGK
jgi:hypothetical protein